MEKEINETLDIIDFGLKYYEKGTCNGKPKRINLLEYFAITPYLPSELSRIAFYKKRNGLGATITEFKTKYWTKLLPLDMEARVNCFYSKNGHVFTPEEKYDICGKLMSEGYPILEGVWEQAARVYMEKGLDGISKSEVSKNLLEAYNNFYGIVPDSTKGKSPKVKK